MIPELVLLALLVGWISGGKFWRLADARIRYVWLIFVPIGLYVVSWAATLVVDPNRLGWVFGSLAILEKVALIVAAAYNLRLPGMKLILIGLLLNVVALAANQGMMPADPNALASVFGPEYVQATQSATHIRSAIMTASSELAFLCDIISAKRLFLVVPAVYSIGDLVMSVGIFIAIIALMRTPLPSEAKKVSVETAHD